MPAQVAPTQQNVIEKTCEYIVPHVFPSHTHHQTNHVYKHVASYPHTESASQQIFNQQFTAPAPGPQVAGAMSPAGPGFGGPQVAGAMSPAGPGFGGPQVAGAMSPGGPGFGGPQVAGAMSPHMHGKGCGCKRR
jgi:uncharacterized phage-like protein YoqJ